MIHGNIGVNSVYVTKSGEWKLGGFEVLHCIKEENSLLKSHRHMLPSEYILSAPELDHENNIPTTAIDVWAFGCLIYYVFNGLGNLTRSSLENRGKIPSSLFRHYRSLTVVNPSDRAPLEKFLKMTLTANGYFDDKFIKTSLFLEQLALKDKIEKEDFLL